MSANLNNMSPAAMAAWARLNQGRDAPLSINSAYRDPAHNAKVGGAKKSQHMHGNAFDVDARGLNQAERIALIERARASGFQGVGVYNNALHFDVGPSRAWGSDYTGATLPGWAKAAVGAPVGTYEAGHSEHDGHDHGQNALMAPQAAPQPPSKLERYQQANALMQMIAPPAQQLDPRAFMTQNRMMGY